MFRIVRASTLDAIRADSALLPAARTELDQARREAAAATDSAIRAETVAEDMLRDLAKAHAARFEAERERDRARSERDRTEADTRQQLDEIREDLARLREFAADTETGQTVKAGVAYRVLRDLLQDARTRGLELGRPLDLVAIVLGLSAEPQPLHSASTRP